MKNRLAVFSANYNYPGNFDAFRNNLFQHFADTGLEVLIVQATDFFYDVNTGPKLPNAADLLIGKLKVFHPDAVLFINGAGRIPEVQDCLEELSIPSLTWYWDHPAIHSKELLRPSSKHKYAAVNRTYIEYFENELEIHPVTFIPFPAVAPKTSLKLTEKAWSARSIPIIFMGTIWNPGALPSVAAQTARGIGENLESKSFFPLLEKDAYLRNLGRRLPSSEETSLSLKFRSNWTLDIYYLAEINSFFSGRERLQYLRSILDLGLQVFGPKDCWIPLIESFLPEFSAVYTNQNVSDPEELTRLLQDSRIGLNTFHRQNQGGGTNFRFVEYAMARTPIVSTPNKECERVFPEGAAAFYVKDPIELRETCKMLVSDPSAATKAANNAFQLATEEFGVKKIAASLLNLLALSPRQIKVGSTFEIFTAKSAERDSATWVPVPGNLLQRSVKWTKKNGVASTALHGFELVLTRALDITRRLEANSQKVKSCAGNPVKKLE